MTGFLRELIYGRTPILNGLVAIFVISAIVLGCTCNDKDGFQWGSNTTSSSNDTTDDKTDSDDKTPAKKADASKKEIPEDEELEAMIKDTLLDFDRALKSEDFSSFYDNISEEWQKQTSPRQLKRLFQSFIDGKADLSSVRNLEPDITDGPAIRESVGFDMLEVKGSFDTSPRTTTFELKYIANGEDWKLSAISVVTGLQK
ncbi:MAG: hypothetical protein IPM63_04025 [Acidobacteriota bacterium]|nr:MAG: hypothetical protein IPM63_04025 [Acidobacteriota bacterium]